mgnify:CR=1 FL=1
MSFIFGGGGSAPAASSGTTQAITREAPGVEARKLSLYDQAAKLASTPVNLPAVQVAPLSQLEQTGIQQAGITGVGAPAIQAGIASVQQAQQAPNISQFLNPYQSYVTDEITRQSQMRQNQLAAQAVQSGAFGGARQGIQAAEEERNRLGLIGQAQAQGFGTALQAAQNQQRQQLTGGQLLGALGAQQQAASLADINQLMTAGGLQRGIGQAALDAQRQTALQRAYEPYQRIEFLKGIMTNLPTTQSTLTATTAPGANPVGQALGAGLGAYSAYNLMQPR